MKWRVTLEEQESGEVIVIEQTAEGKLTCSPMVKNAVAAANTAPKALPKAETKAEAKAETKAETKPTPAPKEVKAKPKKTRAARKVTPSLNWELVKDHDYRGISARSTLGVFKALISKTSLWALFYEQKGVKPRHIGCFKREAQAKQRAQELHDAGWPVSEVVPITAEQVDSACPSPHANDGTTEAERPERADEPGQPEAPAPASTPAPTPDAKHLMQGLGNLIVKSIDDDTDDED